MNKAISNIKKKLFLYSLIGIGFGVVDWGFQEFFSTISRRLPNTPLMIPVMLFAIYGVWLVPAWFVARDAATHSWWFAALSTTLMWAFAVISYYIAYGFALLFYGLPNMDHLLWRNRANAAFTAGWDTQLQPLLIEQTIDWAIFALITGPIVGLAIATLTAWLRRSAETPSSESIESIA